MQKALSYVFFDGDLYKRNTSSSKMYGKEKSSKLMGELYEELCGSYRARFVING